MANNQNLFFYAPTWDYPPNGPIKLGNVLTSVKKPERPLHCVPPTESDVFSTKKMSVGHDKDQLRNEKFSILVRFFSIFGFDIQQPEQPKTSTLSDVYHLIKKQTSKENKFSFKTVETTQFVPTASYIQSCVENDDVRRFLQISRYRKPVYVITGLKVVTGVEANMHTTHTVRSSPSIQIGSTIPHVGPITFGGGPGTEILVGKETGQVVSEDDYRKGAMLGNEEEGQEIKGPQLSILKVEDPDAEGEGFGVEELTEGEDVVVCAIPRED
ncbi:hypothetical protein TrVFT333_002218 [Trichoderma virens FT-333]|nr:hypothetical protein TrVFT333_002218 [Trichoderma virens FT-333]